MMDIYSIECSYVFLYLFYKIWIVNMLWTKWLDGNIHRQSARGNITEPEYIDLNSKGWGLEETRSFDISKLDSLLIHEMMVLIL